MSFTALGNVFKVIREVKGIPVEFSIHMLWDYECRDPESFFGNEEADRAYLRKFETGEIINAILRVRVFALGNQGIDYLGGCHVNSRELEPALTAIAAEYGMVNIAINDCIENIMRQIETLKPFFNK